MEKIFADKILQVLGRDFIVTKEVYGSHFSGARLRIDAVLKPKNICEWKNSDVSLGIEFKFTEKLASTKDKTLWLKQCIDYANTKWDDYGYIYVFSCPSISGENEGIKGDPWLWNRILSNLGVGRLDYHVSYGWTFYLQDQHRIWSEKHGVVCGKHWDLKRKFGRDSFVQLWSNFYAASS